MFRSRVVQTSWNKRNTLKGIRLIYLMDKIIEDNKCIVSSYK